jgi:hypothetical protein
VISGARFDVSVAFAPFVTYRQATASETNLRWFVMLRWPALVLLVIAVLVPIMAVQRVTAGLVLTAALSWSFVLAIQLIIGAGIILSGPQRRLSMPQALDLWFAGHLPYSLWMLVVFAWMGTATTSSVRVFVISALVPTVWTMALVFAFCREVLGVSVAGAIWRTTVHLVVVWGIGLSYIAWAAGGWFQVF